MKRKIAFLLAAAMTVSMLPMNVLASSSNNPGRTDITVNTDATRTDGIAEILTSGKPATLEVRPNNAVESTDSIILNVENGEFSKELIDDYAWSVKAGSTTLTWNDYNAQVEYARAHFTDETEANGSIESWFADTAFNKVSDELPYSIKFINDNEIQVFLSYVSAKNANNKDSLISDGTPYYNIKLPIDVSDSSEGAVTVSVDNNYTRLTSGSYTIATVTDDDGSTTASISSSDYKVTSNDFYNVGNITIKEDTADVFKSDSKITIKTNGKYEFDGNDVKVEAGVNAAAGIFNNAKVSLSSNNKTLTIDLSDCKGLDAKRSMVIGLVVSGIKLTTDEDDYGKIQLTVDGSKGITRQVLDVGERGDYGFSLTVLEEVPTIFAGRTYLRDHNGALDLDRDDFATAEFEFAETTPDTWLDGRKLEFTVPDGVKILAYEVTDKKYFKNTDYYKTARLTDDGTTLRFNGLTGAVDPDECTYMDLKLYLTTAADYSGDVTVGVSGAGLDKDQITPVTVAKVVSPVTVEATPTEANIGYKSVATSDIKITENEYGALLEAPVYIKLDDTYDSDIAFDDTDVDYTVDGEVEIKNFKVTSGEIHFTVDSSSYNNPSTITITGVKVGTTRSIPYGSYSVIVGGDALVNNYKEDVDVSSNVQMSENQDLYVGAIDDDDDEYEGTVNGDKVTLTKKKTNASEEDYDLFEVEGFEFKDYLTIKTDTGTLDGKVEVTIGSNTIKMDGKEVAMDTAAYIQTASNSTMVPLRFVALAIGVDQAAVEDADNTSKITWDANNKVATILYAAGNGQKIIQFQANSPVMVIDGTAITMENGVKAEIVDGRMFVPFRALGTALGVPVSWDAETRTAIYN